MPDARVRAGAGILLPLRWMSSTEGKKVARSNTEILEEGINEPGSLESLGFLRRPKSRSGVRVSDMNRHASRGLLSADMLDQCPLMRVPPTLV